MRLDPGRRQGARHAGRGLRRAEQLGGPGADPRPPGRARRRRSGAAGGVPAPTGAAGRGPAARPAAGRATPGKRCSICCPTDVEALESLARIFNSQADWISLVRSWSARCRSPSPAAPPTSACSAPRSSRRSCTTPTPPRSALEQLIAEIDPRNIVAHARLRTLLRVRRGLAARRQGRRAAAVPDRGSGAARAARDGAGRAGPRQARRRQEGDLDLRARAGDGRRQPARRCTRSPTSTARSAITSGWPSPTRSCWNARPIRTSAGVLMLQIATLYETHLDDARARASSGTGARTWRRPTPRACSWSIRRRSATACSRS